jgi:S1-C subfamily serine protease
MVRYLAGLLALWAALATSLAHAEPADITAAARSVVRVVLIADADGEPSLVGHGSGFAVAPDIILTNAHVVEPARDGENIRIGIVPPQGETGWFARIIAVAPSSDLALVKLTERGSLPPSTLFTGPVGDGADVFAVGYPGNVDLAQGLNVGDIVSPTLPVKTRGNVSGGRSSKSFETILHNAAIGSGNSGGPLLDSCGRVIGANSFGTVSGDGDSEFYFAVSAREIMRFLRASEVSPRHTGVACRSLAELDRAEAERLAGEKVHSEEAARALAAQQRQAAERAERAALLEVLAERENGMGLAGLALLLALAAGGAAYVFVDGKRRREAKIAGTAAGLLVIGALVAWFLRPGLAEVDARAREWANDGAAAPRKPLGKDNDGNLLCTFDMPRSRATVSDISDIELAWSGDGCANGREQYGLAADGWSLVTLADADDSVTVARFDPTTGAYLAERYFLDLEAMAKLRAQRDKLPKASCGDGEEAARKLGEAQAGLRAMLSGTPNERLAYRCRKTR